MRYKVSVLNGNLDSCKLTLQANIPFSFLKGNKVRFTFMKDPSLDPYSFESDNLSALSAGRQQDFYQRRIDKKRVDEIKKYIRNCILLEHAGKRVGVIFPTAVLLAVQNSEILRFTDLYVDSLLSEDAQFLIVDGQHRLYSMMELYNDVCHSLIVSDQDSDDYIVKQYLDEYKFNCTILLNFDLWEQARIFADVNFNQKKVDRSLYYSIYGMHYSEDETQRRNNYIYIAHHLVNFLNSSSVSPLMGKVRMLGNKKGLISQAFLADALIRHIQSPRGVWYVDSSKDETKGNYRYMAREVVSYFTFIKNTFPSLWPVNTEHRSILLKTTGIGALLRLMGYIHQRYLTSEIVEDFSDPDSGYVVKSYYDILQSKFEPVKFRVSELFRSGGEFAGTGGKGLESRLYRELCRLIDSKTASFVEQKIRTVNGTKVRANIYRDVDGNYFFELSHYFKNPDQMEAYHPGSGSIDKTKEGIDFKLRLYFDQISPDAISYPNRDFCDGQSDKGTETKRQK